MKTETKKVPALRFPEFDGDWEEKRLGKACTINPKTNQLPTSFIYIDLESVEKGTLIKEIRIDVNNAPSRAQRLLKHADILYQTVRPYQKNNLFFDKKGKYVASTGYAQLRTKNSPEFLFQYLHTENFVNKVLTRCTGTSYPAINSNDLDKIPVRLPSKPEQEKIASVLTSVDDKIQKVNQELEMTQAYKKGLLQQMFV